MTTARPIPALKFDDWANSSASIGGVRDKHRGIMFSRRARLSPAALELMYEQHSIVARIIDLVVDDAFRVGWCLKSVTTSDDSEVDLGAVRSDFDDLGIDAALAQAAKWSRLYGGALVVLPTLNGGRSDLPLHITPATKLLRAVVIPAERALPLTQDVGILSPTYGRTLRWQIQGLAEAAINIHHSRALVFEPIKLPLEALQRNNRNGWGPSILERMFDDLGRDGAAASHAVSMMYVASILYVQLHGYRAEHATKAGKAKIRALLATLRENLDAHGILGLDAEDKIGNLTLAINGAHELMDRCRDRVASVADYPREILFNESPAGLNAGELSGPQEIYFGRVSAWWGETIRPHLDRALEIYFKLRNIPATKWELELEPLWTKSDKDASETHARNATADAAYMDKGVLSDAEVRKARFVDGNAGQIVVAADVEPETLALDPNEVAAEVAANAPAPPTAAEVDLSKLVDLIARVNKHELTYEQGIGVLGIAFPSLRGREATVLGPPPDPATAAAAADPVADEGPVPADVLSVQEAAKRFGVKTRSITRMIEVGKIRHWGIGTHRVVSLGEIAKLAERNAPELEAEDPADPSDQDPEPDGAAPQE